MKNKSNQINYIEFRAKNLKEIKDFYSEAFGWSFIDYGPTYTAFSESGLAGGALVVLYHKNLSNIKTKIIDCGGKITKDIFSFPGGKRFQFLDPSGNELAVWSDK